MNARTMLVAALAVLCAPMTALAGQSELAHTAPWLGSTLELSVSGAPAFAHVALLVSPRPGDVDTPWGRLELERAQIQVADLGTADVMGRCTFQLPLPSDPAFAEMPLHYQALVRPHTGTPELSAAVHLRILGSRAYASCRGVSAQATGVVPGELSIVSLTRAAEIASVPYGFLANATGPLYGEPEPVFDAALSRGAVMASPAELVLFDPFFGRVLARTSFENASRTLHASADGSRFFVLDLHASGSVSADVHAIDFATGQTLAVVPLQPGSYWPRWVVEPQSGIAHVSSSWLVSPLFVERFDLAALQDLGPVPVGDPTHTRISALASAPGIVCVASDDGQPFGSGALTRITQGGGALSVTVSPEGSNTTLLEPVLGFGALALWSHAPTFPGGYLRLGRLSSSTGTLSIFVPNGGGVLGLAESPLGLWILSANSGLWSGGYTLAHYDVATQTTVIAPTPWFSETPAEVEHSSDFEGERVCVAVDGLIGQAVYIRPALYVHAPTTGATHSIPIGPGPESLRIVGVP